jgi:hypothetical protein
MSRPLSTGPTPRWVAVAAAAAILGIGAWSAARDRVEPTPPKAPEAAAPMVSAVPASEPASPAAPVASRPAKALVKQPQAPSEPAGPVAQAPAAPEAVPAPARAPGSGGMIVGIDPETGQLGMPTPEQMKRLFPTGVSALNQSDEGLPITYGPDGTISRDLQGRFQEYVLVRIGPDGRKRVQCLNDPAAIHRALETPAPAPAPARYEEE